MPAAARRRLPWLAPLAVLALAAVLRLWALGRPGVLVFDELYYVRDAISQLGHGYPTVWPDDDPDMGGGRALGYSDEASNAVHPPLGKWIIGLGVLAFGPDTGWGWRSAVAVAGVATVALTMRLGWLLTRSLAVACLAGLLLAIDGVHVTLSRVGLLDGPLTLLVLLGALLMWRDHEQVVGAARRGIGAARPLPILWRRPWLLAAGAVFGAAAAVKWSGLYPLAAFLLLTVARDVVLRLRAARPAGAASAREAPSGAGARSEPSSGLEGDRGGRLRLVPRALLQAVAAGLVALPAAVLVYAAGWSGWILTSGGWAREPGVPWPVALARYHADLWAWHTTLTAPHPFASHPLTWPLALRPTAMYEARWPQGPGCPWAEGCVAAVSPLPNLLVTWGGVAALLVLAALVCRALWRAVRRGSSAPLATPAVAVCAFVLTGYLSGWLPWVLTVSRSSVFQFYAVVLTPFAALALALVLGSVVSAPLRHRERRFALLRLSGDPRALLGRRISVAIALIAAVAVAILFFPLWSGAPVADWFWRAHLWLPGWR